MGLTISKYQWKQFWVNICRKHDQIDQKNKYSYKFKKNNI